MYSSQKNPKALFQKRKTQKPTLPPPANNHHHNQTHHQQQPQETNKRKRNTKNCQKPPPPIEEIAKKLPKNTKNCQKHTKRKNHFKPMIEEITSNPPNRRSPQSTDQQTHATD